MPPPESRLAIVPPRVPRTIQLSQIGAGRVRGR